MPRPSPSVWIPRALRGSPARRQFRPEVQSLEARDTPTRTWVGPDLGLWSNPANWQENAIPAPGEDLIFNTANTGVITTVNDLPGQVSVNSIQFTGGSFRLTGTGGSSVALTGGGVTSNADATKLAAINVIDLPVSFTVKNQTVSAAKTGNQLAFGSAGAVTLGTVTVTFDAIVGAVIGVGDGSTATLTDGIGGTGNVVTQGDGLVRFLAANTYTGTTTVLGGKLELASPAVAVASPSIPGTLVIGDGDTKVTAQVVLSAPDQISDNAAVTVLADGLLSLAGRAESLGKLTVTGGTVDLGGGVLTAGDGASPTSVTLTAGTITGLGASTGTLALNGDLATVANDNPSTIGVRLDFLNGNRRFDVPNGNAGTDLLLTQGIANATGWVKDKAGTVEIQAVSSFNGATSILDGTLVLNVPTPFGSTQALPNDVFIGDGFGPTGNLARSATLRTAKALQLNNMSFTLADDGYLDPNNFAQQIAGLSGTGNVSIGTGTGAPDLTVGMNDVSTTYDGKISGEGRLVKIGTGTLTLTGRNTFDNATKDGAVAAAGTLIVNGTHVGAGNGVQVGDAGQAGGTLATLGGSGTVGSVRIVGNANVGGASVNPGDPTGGVGVLNVDSIDAKANTMAFDLKGINPGTEHDQIRTATVPTFTSNTAIEVRVDPAFVPAPGSIFVLVSNDSKLPVTSRYSYFDTKLKQLVALPEGGKFPDTSGLGYNFYISYQGGDGNDIVIVEGSSPTATITRTNAAIQNDWFNVQYKIQFSAPVVGFDVNNLQFTGTAAFANVIAVQSPDPVSINPVFYVTLFSPDPFEGTAGITLPAGSVTSFANVPGQLGVTNPDQIYTVDTVAPTVTIAAVSPASGFTNGNTVDFVATFSEKVTGFDATDISVTGSTTKVSNFVAGSDGRTFTFTVDQAGVEGNFTVVIPAGSGFDIANNGNVVSAPVPGGFDQTAPTAQILLQPPSPTNGPGTFRVTFSEPIAPGSFTATDVLFDKSTAPGVLRASVIEVGTTGTVFNVQVNGMTAPGTVRVSIAPSAVTDRAGNPNLVGAVSDADLVFDNAPPTPVVASSSPVFTKATVVPVSVTFPEPLDPLTPFGRGSVLVQGAALLTDPVTTDGLTFTFDVGRQTTDGPFAVSVPQGQVRDLAGNLNATSNLLTGAFDTTGPTPRLTIDTPLTNQPFLLVVADFREAVAGLPPGSVVLTGAASLGPITQSADGRTFTIQVNRIADGAFTIAIAAGATTDLAGNPSAASPPAMATFDTTGPAAGIARVSPAVISGGPAEFRITFSEAIDTSSFLPTDLILSNSTAPGNLAATIETESPTSFLVRVVGMNGNGLVVLGLRAGGVTDVAGNPNPASVQTNEPIEFFLAPPVIVPAGATGIASGAAEFRITFADPINPASFGPGDLDLTNSTAGGTLSASLVQESATDFRIQVTGMTTPGDVIVGLLARSVVDNFGNVVPTAEVFSTPIAFNNVAPTTTLTTTAPPITAAGSVPFTVRFSTRVVGFSAVNVSATGGTVTGFAAAPDGQTFTFNLNRFQDGPYTVVVAAGVTTDTAGNSNLASNAVTGRFDSGIPSADISSTVSFPSAAQTVPVTVRFSEPVNGFGVGSVVVTGGGQLVNFEAAGDGQTFVLTVARVRDGSFTVAVPAGVVTDAAGNRNTASGVFTGAFDTVGPTVTVTAPVAFSGLPIRFIAAFSEVPAAGGQLTPSGVALGGTASAGATVTVLPTEDPRQFVIQVTGTATAGTITAQVARGAVSDPAGNPNTASNVAVVRFLPSTSAGTLRPVAVGTDAGLAGVVRTVTTEGVTGTEIRPFGGVFTGGVRTAQGDFNGDGTPDVVVGTGPGAVPYVTIYDGSTGNVIFDFQPFERAFTGGVYVSTGDLTGDGFPELVISPDVGGGPRVQVLDGTTFQPVADFFGIDDPAFRGGARTSVADFNADGFMDLVVAAGVGGGPRVAVWDGASLSGFRFTRRVFADFFVFEQTLRNGAYVAAADVDGDGYADLIAGGGPGGAPRVRVLSGRELLNGLQEVSIVNFFSDNVDLRGGVRVAAVDVNGDGVKDIVTGTGPGGPARVQAFSGGSITDIGTPLRLLDSTPFPDYEDGIFVG